MLGSNNEKNDPLEEFEFRPINEGLGFHRKQKQASQMSSSLSSQVNPFQAPAKVQNKTSMTSNTQASLTLQAATGSPFQTSLPRNETRSEIRNEIRNDITKKSSVQIPTIQDDSIAKAQTAVNEILKNLNQKRQLDFSNETEKQKIILKKSKPQLFAATLDGMLVLAGFLMTLILMLSITKIDMILNLTHPETSGMVYLATFALFAAVTFIYMVVNRSILGYTPGEWAFDQQCGQNDQNDDVSFILRIALRTLVVMASGFITLPFLSYLFNKDIAGEISGAYLFKKPHGL
ncbi:MAG: metalloendopeptidase [Pseudobdellovibrio sp.]